MRVGDLDALKEQFTEGAYTSKGVREIIDNAPPVEGVILTEEAYSDLCLRASRETYMTGEDYDLYMKGYKQARKDFERPQGEWIGIEEYDDYPNKKVCECSECGKVIYISHNDFHNFCSYCGADMRGKEE